MILPGDMYVFIAACGLWRFPCAVMGEYDHMDLLNCSCTVIGRSGDFLFVTVRGHMGWLREHTFKSFTVRSW